MTVNFGSFTAFALMLLTLTAVGCGDNEEASPEDKCEMVASAHCVREAECGASLFRSRDEQQRFVDLCEVDFRSGFCNKATSVSQYFDDCLRQLPSATCEFIVDSKNGFTPSLDVPLSCRNVINYTK